MQELSISRWLAASLLAGSLIAGCATIDDPALAVDTTAAPLLGDAASAIAGEYIVVFHDDLAPAGLRAARNRISLRSTGSRVLREYSVIPALAARLGDEDLAAIRLNPDVAYVERNTWITASKIEGVLADGIDRIDQRSLPRDGLYNDRTFDGRGVRVYIIDTGIRPTHTEFTGRIGGMADFVGDGRNGVDCNGHGTHIASIAAGTQFGVADRATIHAVRVLDCNGGTPLAVALAGVDHVVQECASGTPCVANFSGDGAFSTAMNSAIENAVAQGTPFTVSAGNNNTDACTRSPASAPSAMTVAAVDDNDCRAAFSNFGACLDIFAPGVTILGAGNGDTATNSISGTSMAAAHVAGVMAGYLQHHPLSTPAQVEAAIDAAASTVTCGGTRPLLFNGLPPGESCAARCGNFDASRPCQCDSACVALGDCCFDGPC